MNLATVAAARNGSPVPISWATLFVRAIGLVAVRRPVLRQCYMRWPWSHVYETEASVAKVAVQREFEGERWVFFGRLRAPEASSLQAIEARMAEFRTGPVEQTFRVQLHQSRLPLVVRRAMGFLAYHCDASRRAKHFGTFGLTTVGSLGATIDTPPLINSASFSYGPIDAEGRCRLTVAYDHRITDGTPIAEILADVEATLCGAVCDELAAVDADRARAS